MSDVVDDAAPLVEALVNDGIEAIRSLVPVAKELAEDEIVECLMCGEIIPEKRAAQGYETCVDCVKYQERQDKRRRSFRERD